MSDRPSTQPPLNTRLAAHTQINRTLVRRLARRATIGIPILGLYFVTRVLCKDAANFQAHYAAGDTSLAALYALAVAAEGVDVVAQTLITVGMGVTSGLLTLPAALPASLFSAAALPVLIAAADRLSIACATVSCGVGLAGEAIKAHLEGGGGEQPGELVNEDEACGGTGGGGGRDQKQA